jgi:hypothetical protein
LYTDGKMLPPDLLRFDLLNLLQYTEIQAPLVRFRVMEENTHEHDERCVAEDFRRQLQERLLAGRVHPPTAELLRWLNQNPELLEQIAQVSWGATPGTGLTPERFLGELAAVPLVTPHDEPFTHSIVHMLSQQIESACQELGIPLHSGVAYGSTAELEVSVKKYGVHFTQASVVTLSTGFITFCSSISRMFALSLPHERAGDRLQVSFAPELVLAKIQSDSDLREYWEKVFGDYAIGSGPLSGNHRLVPFPASYTRGQLLFAMERFSLAHEYGHHIGQHGRKQEASAEGDATGLKNEFEADLFALSVDRYIGVRETRPNVFSASGAAGAVLLKCHDCIRRVRQILLTGDDAIQSDGVHPETSDRIEAFGTLDHELPDHQRNDLKKMRNDFVTVVDEVYRLLRPIYRKMHGRGVRPLPSRSSSGLDGSVRVFGHLR